MFNAEIPRLFPYECFVSVDRIERNVIKKAITYLYEYGTAVLSSKGYKKGRVKVSFPEADAGITILTFPGRQPSRRPLRFYCSESGVTALREGSVNIGIIPEGVTVKPTKYNNRLRGRLKNREPEIIVAKLLYHLENYPPVIDVQFKDLKWQTLHHEVLEQPLNWYNTSYE